MELCVNSKVKWHIVIYCATIGTQLLCLRLLMTYDKDAGMCYWYLCIGAIHAVIGTILCKLNYQIHLCLAAANIEYGFSFNIIYILRWWSWLDWLSTVALSPNKGLHSTFCNVGNCGNFDQCAPRTDCVSSAEVKFSLDTPGLSNKFQ